MVNQIVNLKVKGLEYSMSSLFYTLNKNVGVFLSYCLDHHRTWYLL